MRIYNLNKSYLVPNYELHDQEIISFSKKELVSSLRMRVGGLDDARRVDKCKVKRVLVDMGTTKIFYISNVSKK